MAKNLTSAKVLAFQESIDLTVLLGDFCREDESLGVTLEKYLERLQVFNGKIQSHCNKFFSYYFDIKIPGFDGPKNRPMPIVQYSTNGFTGARLFYLRSLQTHEGLSVPSHSTASNVERESVMDSQVSGGRC